MFESIGWLEIFTLLVIALIVIGPERLPKLIEDIRAAIFAARRAIDNAKKELNGEFGSEFDEIRKPIEQVAQYTRLGPRGAITKALFDGDEGYLEAFDPKKMLQDDSGATAHTQRPNPAPAPAQSPSASPTVPPAPGAATQQPRAEQQPPHRGDYSNGGGFSWADIT